MSFLINPYGFASGGGGGGSLTAVLLSGPGAVLDNAAAGENIGALTATGGTGPYTFSEITDASNKFTIASNGLVTLSATVTAGTISFTARATDSLSATADATFNITVTANTAAYANSQGTGNRTSTISTSLSNIPKGGGNYSDMVDGATTDSLWQGGWAAGLNYTWDFGAGTYKNVTEITWKQSNTDICANVVLQASNDGVGWQKLAQQSLGGAASTTYAVTNNPYGYRYYRVKGSSGARFTGFVREVEFKIMAGPQAPNPVHIGNEWDPQDVVASKWTLSSGNLTATHVTAAAWDSVRAAFGKTTGKWAFRLTPTGSSFQCLIGVSNESAPIWSNYAGQVAGTVGWNGADGNVYKDGTNVANYGTYLTTNPIDVCVDLTNHRMWWRKSSGNWNNSGSADPATNVGGLDISSITGTVFPTVSGLNNTLSVVADFACAGFTPPSGFSPWNS